MSLRRAVRRTPRLAPRKGVAWTPEEDRQVLEARPGDLAELAVRLGRTHNAVHQRRDLLRRRQRKGA
jgi:hypothetical protein